MEKHIIDETNGLSYTLHGDYYLPDLEAPKEVEATYGYYGEKRREFLLNHRRWLFSTLLVEGKLNEHLNEVDERARDMVETLVKQMAKAEGVDEQMKANEMMKWVGLMNNFRASAREIVLNDIVYA